MFYLGTDLLPALFSIKEKVSFKVTSFISSHVNIKDGATNLKGMPQKEY